MTILTLTTAIATSLSINLAQPPRQAEEMKVSGSVPTITNVQSGFASQTAPQSRAAGVTPDMSVNGTTVVGTQPEGQLVSNQYRTGEIYYMFFGAPTYTIIDGDVGQYVVDEANNKLWIYRISARGSYSWVEGEINGNEVVVKTPQCIGVGSTDSGSTINIYLINSKLEKIEEGETPEQDVYTFVEDAAHSEIKYSWDGTNLELKEGMPAYASWGPDFDANNPAAWNWLGYAEMKQKFEPCPYEAQTPPEAIEWTDYVNFSATVNDPSQRTGSIIKIGYDGDDMWIRDLHPLLPDYYVKGTKQADGTYLFKTQFIGLNTEVNYFVFFRPGFFEQDEYGLKLGVDDEITLVYNPETKEFNVKNDNDMWYIQAGKGELSYLQANVTPRLFPYTAPTAPVKPAAPTALYYTEANPEYAQSASLSFNLPQMDVDGNWIDSKNLTYSLYIDGELYTFSQLDYMYLEEDETTAIPYSFCDWYDFIASGLSRIVTIYADIKSKIGVSLNCTIDGQTLSSDIAELEVAGIESAVADKGEPQSTEWFNLFGVRVSEPADGIFIRVSRYADGSSVVEKIAR